jgi:SWI/SNF-related matrix-associated actin-dependent regulator of chromatin subfamily A member 5
MMPPVFQLMTAAEPLTEEELAEKEALASDGFPEWKRNHFLAFVKGLERYGRDSLDKVALDVAEHTEDEVRKYASVFFERYGELKGECGLCSDGFG